MQKEIDKFNKRVIMECIHGRGTFTIECEGRIFNIEPNSYRADDSVADWVGWWSDDHSVITVADSPFEVYSDLP